MLSAIKGYYEKGKIFFNEEPPVLDKTEVVITFLTTETNNVKTRIPGGLKGKVSLPADFNEPLDNLKEYM